jgi:hypothetical protein
MSDNSQVDVVHRLRNHLAVILAFCDLRLAECPAGESRRRADLVEVDKAARAAMAILPDVTRLVEGNQWPPPR